MSTIIIGASGKKQSGKNTLCEGIAEFFKPIFGEDQVKMYSFADMLKEKVCMDVMGLTYEQCYGTDEEKNSVTTYMWERLPREIRHQNRRGENRAPNGEICEFIYPEGLMTAREVMQIVGTDVFRKYFDDSIWVNATFRNIRKEGKKVALISDVRFPSEVEGVIAEDGIIFRLLRDVCETDSHASETALDDYDWDEAISKGQAAVIENQEMTIADTVELALMILNEALPHLTEGE